jgi:hypothetical protein
MDLHMGSRNCPRCGKYLKNGRKKGSIEQHQASSVHCQSMTAEEHKLARAAAIKEINDREPPDGAWFMLRAQGFDV